ncbi:TPA: hypothetical protein RG892_000383 [Pseudomonas aeruginosa]|nr:hypothetical protein [Pseudomonas aeruginosa]
MRSANAFSHAISGSFTEESIAKYADYVNNSTALLQNAGGWLGEQAKKTLDCFTSFVNSRAWEMGKRLLNKNDGEYVGRYSIGYLGSIEALQGAEGYMRDYIMANPVMMQLYLDGEIEGYGGEFSKFCSGVGEENLFYRRSMNGLLNLTTVDDKPHLRHTHYHDSLGGKISFRERCDVQKTWAAIDHHRAKSLFDLTSPAGNKLKSAEEETTEE